MSTTPLSTGETTVCEPSRALPVSGSYDVIVAGGGIAGVSAAIAAAREGASVCLLERTFSLGGLATSGNVIVWLPICDGCGRQVMGGLPEELLKLSVADLVRENTPARYIGIPTCWQPGGSPEERRKTRYQVEFNPASYLMALEELTVRSGVTLMYDTRLCAVQRDGNHLTHLIVENKSGRSALACKTAIDATGDADLCHLAGEETESLDSNVLAGWFYELHPDGLHLNAMSNTYSPHAIQEGAKGPFFRGDTAQDVTAHVLGSRALIRQRLAAARGRHPGVDIQLNTPPAIPCFRMTRRLVGSLSLGESHNHVWLDDAVGLTGDWRRPGPVFCLPWRTLHGVRTRNLMAAGRCISADTTVWDVTRAIPTCAATGTATGTAAAMATRQTGGDVVALPIAGLQQHLRHQGALIDPALVAPVAR